MKITLINGHPNPESYCAALSSRYAEAAIKAGHDVRELNLHEMEFDPILHGGYYGKQELEPALVQAQEDITWCEHLVVVHPIWWGTMPALLKGFFDRILLPGWAFKYRKNSPLWDRLLKGRSARIIVTSDAPALYNRFIHFNAPVRVTKKMILAFCGIKPAKVTAIGSIREMSEAKREEALSKIANCPELRRR